MYPVFFTVSELIHSMLIVLARFHTLATLSNREFKEGKKIKRKKEYSNEN